MNVYQAISAVQKDLSTQGISKDRKNMQGSGYSFRGIDDVYNALAPFLAKHGLCILPRVLNRESVERQSKAGGALFYITVEVEFDLVAADGSKLALDTDGRLRVKAGDSVTVEATGFSFNTRTEVRLYSDPVLLGRTDVDDKGVMNASYEIPEGIPSGDHNVVLAGERDGSPVTMALSVALGEQTSGNALAVVFIGVLIAAGVTALMLPAFLRRRRKEESGE